MGPQFQIPFGVDCCCITVIFINIAWYDGRVVVGVLTGLSTIRDAIKVNYVTKLAHLQQQKQLICIQKDDKFEPNAEIGITVLHTYSILKVSPMDSRSKTIKTSICSGFT